MDLNRLEKLDIGKILINEPLKNHTTFKIGGPCPFMALPETYDQAVRLVGYLKDENIDYYIIGNGSNLLVADEGPGMAIIKIGDQLSDIRIEGEEVIAQAGASLIETSKKAIYSGLTGMEFSSGIPGDVGGAITMNAGAYGGEISHILKSCLVINKDGQLEEIAGEDMDLSYRHSRVMDEGLVVLEARFSLERGDKEQIEASYLDLKERRESKQPLDLPSAGSTFKRPEGHYASKLIDDAGLRGYRYKNAMVSEKHTGFVVALEPSSFEEVMAVIHHVQEVVYDKFQVRLEPEVRILGK